MEPKKKAITRLADAIHLVRAKANDPFDADLAFGMMCGWTVLLLMEQMEKGEVHFVGDICITKRAKFATLMQDFPNSEYAHEKACRAAAELLRAMVANTPFKNVLAQARMDLIKRRGAKIKSDWCRHSVDRARMKELSATQLAATGCSAWQFHGPACGVMGLEAMAMITHDNPGESGKFEISAFCEDRTSLLIAIVQLMFASLLHAYATVELRFYHQTENATQLVFEFTYEPPNWEVQVQFAA